MKQEKINEIVEYIKDNPLASFKEVAYDNNCTVEEIQQAVEESEYSYNEIVDQDEKYPQRVLGKVINLLKDFKSKYKNHYEEVGTYDQAVLDFMHKAERIDLDNEEEKEEFLQRLVPERKRRRTIKNQIWVGQPLFDFVDSNNIIPLLEGIMSDTNKKVTQLDNFNYNPKVYKDLFE